MTIKSPHVGSTFASWLEEKGLREEVTAAAVKSALADQVASAMKQPVGRRLTSSPVTAKKGRHGKTASK